MDENRINDLESLLLDTEGTCPCCGEKVTLIESLFTARQQGVHQPGMCVCSKCGKALHYELKDGGLLFNEDISAPQKEELPVEKNETDPPVEEVEEEVSQQTEEDAQPVGEGSSVEDIQPDREITEEENFQQEESEVIEEEMRTCPKCGKTIPARAHYCPYCRKNLNENKSAGGIKKYGIIAVVAVAVIAVVTALIIYLPNAAKTKNYSEAISFLKDGNYQQAEELFNGLGDYQKSAKYASYCRAVMAFNEGDYESAGTIFRTLGSLENSGKYLSYINGLEKLTAGSLKYSDYQSAAEDFDKAKEIADAAGMADYSRALAAFVSDNDEEAVNKLSSIISSGNINYTYISQAREIISYLNAVKKLENGEDNALDELAALLDNCSPIISRKAFDFSDYIDAMNYYKEKKFYSAMCIFKSIPDVLDSKQMAASCLQARPSSGIVYRSGSSSSVSLIIYDTSDGSDMFVKIYNSSDKLVETLYIRDGSKVTAKLASGSYRIALAVGNGEEWYGTVETFGPDGIYQRLLLSGSSEYYKFSSGKYTLKFNVSDGNVDHKYTNYGDI